MSRPGPPLRLCGCVAILSVASVAWAVDPVGVARSDEPFLVQGQGVADNATVLAGEAVSSNYLPLRVRLMGGHEVALGPGSRARFWKDRVEADGVSVDAQAAANDALEIRFGPLLFELSPGGRAVLYGDRPGLASAWIEAGEMQVVTETGQATSLDAGGVATLSILGGEMRRQVMRAPLEIARIQVRQLLYLRQMAAVRPAIQGRSDELLRQLSTASGGLLPADPGRESRNSASLPAVDSTTLLAAVRRVHAAILAEPWVEAGCGSPECVHRRRVRLPNDFVGWAGGMPPPRPGCELCRPDRPETLE